MPACREMAATESSKLTAENPDIAADDAPSDG
jgi:hypothetical protein